jgi:aspartyl/asparaginyl beta-hydroxylase (cupin superfamily)
VRKPAETCFHDSERFAFVGELRRHWRDIRDEYLGVQDGLIDWFERELYGEGWKVYGLYDFPHGKPIAGNVARCPLTAGLIASRVPAHGAAGFSVLRPGTRIQPHSGYQGNFLRCHLGLSVPEGDCGIRVGGETRAWREGEALVLDDRLEHAAWNLTARERVVLLVDFVPDGAAG